MKPLITEPSLVLDMPEDVYHADPVEGGSLSYTGMKELLKSPAHYRHYVDEPRVEKPAFDAGHIVHALVLGTPLNVTEIPLSVLASNGAASTKAAKEFIAEARLDGLIPVKASEMDPLREIAEAVLAYEPSRALFEQDGPAEVSMFAPDPESGVWIRGRADKLATVNDETVLVDLKTTLSADPQEFNRKAIAAFRYYLQATVYTNLWHWLDPDRPRTEMLFVAVSKTAPHLVSVNRVDWVYEDIGETHMRRAIDRYQAGIETGEWPGYAPIIHDATCPSWLMEDDEEEIEI